MTFDAIFNILYTPCKLEKALETIIKLTEKNNINN